MDVHINNIFNSDLTFVDTGMGLKKFLEAKNNAKFEFSDFNFSLFLVFNFFWSLFQAHIN